jgi:Flp pilus assembly protein TadG
MLMQKSSRTVNSGTVAIELVVLLPLLMFLAVIGVDYARIFSRAMCLETASRNACWYAAQDSINAANTAGIQAVALKDVTDVSPTPTVTSQIYAGTDGFQYVKVTVTMTFTTITNFPAVPNSTQLSRSTEMRICPTTPKAGTYSY